MNSHQPCCAMRVGWGEEGGGVKVEAVSPPLPLSPEKKK